MFAIAKLLDFFYFLILFILPKNLLSRLTGSFSQSSWSKILIPWFVEKYKINTNEVAREVGEYENLHSFFIRDLKPNARPLGPSSDLLSPADGVLTQAGKINEGELLQVKGKAYKVSELLESEEEAREFYNGYYFTVYLAPSNYHHVHSPLNASIYSLKLIPGTLWPVNTWFVSSVNSLFCKNERMIIGLSAGELVLKVIMVGATNVGKISLTFDDLLTNSGIRKPITRKYKEEIIVKAGERLGTFHLGSTVVVLVNKSFSSNPLIGNIFYGQSVLKGVL